MSSLQELQRNWEGFAKSDPLWSICTDPRKRNNSWDEREFFTTGENEIAKVLAYVRSLGLNPDTLAPVLDFGCGVGRLTRALARNFKACWGVDISPTMIKLAQQFHRDLPNCQFVLNVKDNLESFTNDYFGFIYTSIVLQHIERRLVEGYLLELIRILQPGGLLVFQITDRDARRIIQKWRSKVRLRSRLRNLVGKTPLCMKMHCVSEKQIRRLLSDQDVEIVDIKLTNSTELSSIGDFRFLNQEPRDGFISKQYCLIKNQRCKEQRTSGACD
jgi:ubiquinone/menaquinone biosynthesis C-methylase UbiE